MTMKQCSKCGVYKPLDLFHVKRADPSGRQAYCKACNKEQFNAARKGGRDATKPWPEKWITYQAAHMRVKYLRGSASQHVCVDCAGQARDWSYTGGDSGQFYEIIKGSKLAYSTNPEFYVARCKPCHRKHDGKVMA
jgi:hypothetical protein